MASLAEGTGVADVPREIVDEEPAAGRTAWLSLGLAAWIVVGVFVVVRALNLGLADDVGISPWHVVGYLGILALAVVCVAFVVRARRRGGGWRAALPRHHGTLGAGLLVLLAYIVLDVAWREGVGIEPGIESGFAPSRILLLVGLVLVAVGPLRAAVLGPSAPAGGWAALPAVLSAGLVLGLVSVPGGLHPAVNPWLERAPDVPDDDGEIWLMDADGSHQTRLITAPDGEEVTFPVWSPDGTRIAFVHWSGFTGDVVGDADIWVANADGSGQRPLAAGKGWQWLPRWSPDGASIAFTAESQGGPWMTTGPLGPETGFGPLGPGFGGGPVAERPDADLMLVAVDGSGPAVPITDAPGDDRSGSWSPDGSRIAFDATRDGNTEIYVVGADGSNPIRLTDSPAEDWSPSWSPDGSRIAFASDRTGIAQVWVMPAGGGEPVQLTDLPDAHNGPAWSPDGTRIAHQEWVAGEQQIWSMAADGSDRRNLSDSPATVDSMWDGSWGPDGRIAFWRSGHPPAWVQPVARNDLGVVSMLLQALAAAVVALVLIAIRPPFGSFAIALGIATALAASQFDQWRFVPAAIVAGLAVDLVVRFAPERRRTHAAAAGLAVAVVLSAAATVFVTTGLGWTPTLLLGVAFAAGVAGWGLAGLVRPRPTVPAQPGEHPGTAAMDP
jgi:Tol biopolymer transport system component